jgi:hypothetical protein
MKERPITFYAEFARQTGSVSTALFYQQIRYWSDKGSREDGWIYKTTKEIEQETTIQRKSQDKAREKLVEIGWIEAEKMMHKGSMVWHYRLLIDFEFEQKQVSQRTVPSVPSDSCTSVPSDSSSITETTTETTATEREKNSRTGSRVDELADRLPNTSRGKLPEVYGQPPLAIKEAKRIERSMSGMYDNTFAKKAKTVVEYFCELYLEKYGRPYGKVTRLEPVARTLSGYFKEGETVETLKEMLDGYFLSEKANTLALKLTTALSEDTYRLWTQGKLGGKDGGAGIYPMRIGSLVAKSDKDLERMYREGLIVSVGHGKWAPSGKGVSI